MKNFEVLNCQLNKDFTTEKRVFLHTLILLCYTTA